MYVCLCVFVCIYVSVRSSSALCLIFPPRPEMLQHTRNNNFPTTQVHIIRPNTCAHRKYSTHPAAYTNLASLITVFKCLCLCGARTPMRSFMREPSPVYYQDRVVRTEVGRGREKVMKGGRG